MGRLLISLVIIVLGLSSGYATQRLVLAGHLRLPWSLAALRLGLQRLGIMGFMPVAFMGAVWNVRITDPRIAILPGLGILAILFGGGLGWLGGRWLRLAPAQAGALWSTGAMSNIGSLGGLVCFLFLGEPGFALFPLYKLFEEVVYFTICFPVARTFSPRQVPSRGLVRRVREVFSDPFVLAILVAVGTGGLLNLTGVPRPGFYVPLTSFCVPVGTFLLMMSIGLAMRLGRLGGHGAAVAVNTAIKFVAVPLLVCGLGWWAGMGEILEGMPLKVIMIASAMPVGFIALIPPSLYGLDTDQANACWLFTTLGLLVVLPALHWLVASF